MGTKKGQKRKTRSSRRAYEPLKWNKKKKKTTKRRKRDKKGRFC